MLFLSDKALLCNLCIPNVAFGAKFRHYSFEKVLIGYENLELIEWMVIVKKLRSEEMKILLKFKLKNLCKYFDIF